MSEPSFPWSGFVLAFVACIILATLGVDLIYVGLVLLVWVGSLYLVAARPPEAKAAPAGPAFTRDNMADLFEHSETPVVISGAATMKMISSTSITSTIGVTLMSDVTPGAFGFFINPSLRTH